jgi:hypothetical protein
MSLDNPRLYPPLVEPATVEELSKIVGGYSTQEDVSSYGMFWCMRGLPRAFIELPTDGGFTRFTYSVIGFESAFPREAAEPRLVVAMYRFLKARRVEALQLYGQNDVADKRGEFPIPPVLLVRRDFELDVWFDSNKTRLTYRMAIPGVDLSAYDIYRVKDRTTYTQVDSNVA